MTESDTTTKTPTETTKLEQSVTVEDIGPARKKITIEIPESRIRGKIDDTFGTLQTDTVLPGFRRGRAPRRLIEKRFGEDVRSDARGQIISESFSQAVDDQNIDVLGEPDVKDIETLELPESGPMTLEIEVEVTPEVELPDFTALKVTRISADVSDADLDNQIESYCGQFGRIADAPDGKIKSQDYIQANAKILAGENAGEDAEVIDEQENVYIGVHDEDMQFKGHVLGILVDDMGKRLIGKGIDHEETISMTGPTSHENEKIKDQPITITLKVTKIERVEPAKAEEVATQMGYETEETFREELKKNLEARKLTEQKSDMHDQVRKQLVELTQLDLPEGITRRQAERNLSRQRMEMLYRGQSAQDIEQNLAELRTSTEEDARKQLAEFFILNKSAKQLEIEINENELNGRIAGMAIQQRRRPEKLRQEMQKRGDLENLYLQLREQKTLDKIIEQAAVTDAKPEAETKTETEAETKTETKTESEVKSSS